MNVLDSSTSQLPSSNINIHSIIIIIFIIYLPVAAGSNSFDFTCNIHVNIATALSTPLRLDHLFTALSLPLLVNGDAQRHPL